MNSRTKEALNEWISRCVHEFQEENKSMSRWTMNEYVHAYVNECVNARINDWMTAWMNKWENERMNQRTGW